MEQKIQILVEKLELPKYLAVEASTIYNDNLNLFKIKSEKEKNILKTASLFMACRINNIPRTLKDIACAGNIYRRDLFKKYSKLLSTDKYIVSVIDPIIYLNRIISRFNIDVKTVKWAQNILTNKSEICSLVGSDPMMRAGVILYISCIKNKNKDMVLQKDIANVCGVADITIMTNFKKLKEAGIDC